MMIHGISRDAGRIAGVIADRTRASAPRRARIHARPETVKAGE
jgi:hypothetical protein